jgi:hypothetical protein
MTEIFTWKNCRADVYSYRYGAIAKEFLALVIYPALDALDYEIQKWEDSEDPISHFMIADITELTEKTRMAFCLSIQSLWERQIRTYLSGCHQELKIDLSSVSKRKASDVAHIALWGDELNTVFERLRGVTLQSFDSYQNLNLLQLVGNVCRHGDGPSSRQLWKDHPELWPTYDPAGPFHDPSEQLQPPPADMMIISRDLLTSFVEAIDLFWDDTEYIYNESIEVKAASLKTRLTAEREKRQLRSAR